MAKFILPFPDSQLTGHFGKIRTINGKQTPPHRGTDWAAPKGTPIPAVSSGTVQLVQFSKVLGWVLVQSVMGSDKKVRYVGYCHMDSEPKLKVGAKLRVGQEIGKVGNTGLSSGPHLHATLSDELRGVFSGSVSDLYIFLSEEIKKASQVPPAKPNSPAKPKKCPTCGQDVK